MGYRHLIRFAALSTFPSRGRHEGTAGLVENSNFIGAKRLVLVIARFHVCCFTAFLSNIKQAAFSA